MPDSAGRGDSTVPRETYTVGYGAPARDFFGARSAERFAQFLLPHLSKGMSLLDVGCGPGSITVGLAEALAPGEVVGIDIAAVQVETASELAAARGVSNVRFEVASAYELPLFDASFDAVFGSHVLHHLREPQRALSEVRRVLKPGGVVGVIDPDWSSWLLEPTTRLLGRYRELHMRIQEYNGGDYNMARHLRRILLDAGFAGVEASALANFVGTSEGTRLPASVIVDRLEDPAFADAAITNGWSDAVELSAMADDARAWGEKPDAFWSVTACAAVGWGP